jgi:hypothetical protein
MYFKCKKGKPLGALVLISTYLMEYSENMESSGGSQRTSTELLVTFSIVRFWGGCGTETCKKKVVPDANKYGATRGKFTNILLGHGATRGLISGGRGEGCYFTKLLCSLDI